MFDPELEKNQLMRKTSEVCLFFGRSVWSIWETAPSQKQRSNGRAIKKIQNILSYKIFQIFSLPKGTKSGAPNGLRWWPKVVLRGSCKKILETKFTFSGQHFLGTTVKPPLTPSLCVTKKNPFFSCEAQLNKCTCVSVCLSVRPFQNVILPAYDSFWKLMTAYDSLQPLMTADDSW